MKELTKTDWLLVAVIAIAATGALLAALYWVDRLGR